MSTADEPRVAADIEEALGDFSTGETVAVCLPDGTRPLDLAPVVRALRPRLPKARHVIGLGLHRPMSTAELGPLSSDCVQSDPDDVVATVDWEDIPGSVTRVVAEAGSALSVGVFELHQYAGFSGGHKGVAVGCGGRATIAALHHRDRAIDPRVRIGALDGNPFREAVDALGRAAGCRWALLWVPAAERWVWGEPTAATQLAAGLCQPWTEVSEAVDAAWLLPPPSKARSFYQASRAATYLALSPRPPLRPGATLYVDAACEEGLGAEEGFVRALQSCPPPWTDLLEGPAPTGAGAQRAVILAVLARSYRVVVTGCRNVEALRAVGVDATAGPPPACPMVVDRPFERLPQLTQPTDSSSTLSSAGTPKRMGKP